METNGVGASIGQAVAGHAQHTEAFDVKIEQPTDRGAPLSRSREFPQQAKPGDSPAGPSTNGQTRALSEEKAKRMALYSLGGRQKHANRLCFRLPSMMLIE